MEFLGGGSLDDVLVMRRFLPEAQAGLRISQWTFVNSSYYCDISIRSLRHAVVEWHNKNNMFIIFHFLRREGIRCLSADCRRSTLHPPEVHGGLGKVSSNLGTSPRKAISINFEETFGEDGKHTRNQQRLISETTPQGDRSPGPETWECLSDGPILGRSSSHSTGEKVGKSGRWLW